MFLTSWHLFLSISNGATARGGSRPPSRVSSILPGLGRLFSNFYTLALLHLPPLHLPSAAWVSLWGAFLLAHWGGLSWINHRRPGVWHVLPISVYSACRISQCHSHYTVGRVLIPTVWSELLLQKFLIKNSHWMAGNPTGNSKKRVDWRSLNTGLSTVTSVVEFDSTLAW